MSQRQRAKTQGSSLKVAWQDIPWKKVQRHVFRLQKRIYRATQRGRCQNGTQASEVAGEVMVCTTVSGASHHPGQPGETHRGHRWGQVPHPAATMATGQRAPSRWHSHRRSDAPGYPSVGQRRKSAHWAFPPNTTGHGKRWCAKPWNPNGKPSCHRIPMAFAQDAPARMPSEPSLPHPVSAAICAQSRYREMLRSHLIIRPSWPKCRRPLGSADNSKPGSKRGSWKMATSFPPPQGRHKAGAVRRCWR